MKAWVTAFVVVLTFTSPVAKSGSGTPDEERETSWFTSVRHFLSSAVIDIPLAVAVHEMNPPCLKRGPLKTYLENQYKITGNKNRALVLLSNALVYEVASLILKALVGLPSHVGLLRTSAEVLSMFGLHMVEKVPGTESVAQYITFCASPARSGSCCHSSLIPAYMFRNAAVGWLLMHMVSAMVH